MTKPEWGKKLTCQSCGVPFYDLHKKTPECPKCGTPFNAAQSVKQKRAASETPSPAPAKAKADEAAAEKAKVTNAADNENLKPAPANDIEAAAGKTAADKTDPDLEAGDGAGTDVGDEGKNDELIEDTSDLGEDDDDMSEVKEHIDDGVEDKT